MEWKSRGAMMIVIYILSLQRGGGGGRLGQGF